LRRGKPLWSTPETKGAGGPQGAIEAAAEASVREIYVSGQAVNQLATITAYFP
jgi:hypothetical protein